MITKCECGHSADEHNEDFCMGAYWLCSCQKSKFDVMIDAFPAVAERLLKIQQKVHALDDSHPAVNMEDCQLCQDALR